MNRLHVRALTGLAALLLAAGDGRTATLHVPADFATIQDAVTAAVPDDTVLVAPGTYVGTGNRDIDFLGKAIVLRSSGGAAVTVIDCEGAPATPHRGFYLHSGETPATQIVGFTVRNGYAAGGGIAQRGGGVYLQNASPTIGECVFEDNTAQGDGGALHCRSQTSPFIRGCRFSGNHAGSGGAVAGVLTVSPVFEDCLFEGNSAISRGGGILFASPSGNPVLRRCEVRDNAAMSSGGGAHFDTYVNALVEDCLFDGNSAYSGGGVFSHWEAPTRQAGSREVVLGNEPTYFTRCVFTGNTAVDGAGLLVENMSPLLFMTSCTFVDNTATNDGGALSITEAPLRMTSSTLAGNEALRGSGLFLRGSPGWETAELGRSIVAFGLTGEAVHCDGGAAAVLQCCDVYGNDGGDWIGCLSGQSGMNGNFSSDPLFCDLPADDVRLNSASPCVTPQLPVACGEFVGAWGVGCGTAAVPEGPVDAASWGRTKATFQER